MINKNKYKIGDILEYKLGDIVLFSSQPTAVHKLVLKIERLPLFTHKVKFPILCDLTGYYPANFIYLHRDILEANCIKLSNNSLKAINVLYGEK